MPSGRMIKLVVYEVLQVACLSVPMFVVMERFASLMLHVRGDLTAYWLVVAASMAYVTSVSLLVWVPLRYLVLKQRTVITDITQWCRWIRDHSTDRTTSLSCLSLLCSSLSSVWISSRGSGRAASLGKVPLLLPH
uniref:Uncharacterized protein n=1 Tax=Hucho hucho TaxID=62062 RepID=A0A4W5JDZ5_9TELE